jgi:serine/threonine protein kinase
VDYYTGDLLPVIVQQNENYDKTRRSNVGDVEYSRSNPIGQGGFGTVFAGIFKGEKVAVKRVQLADSVSYDSTEVINNKKLLNHPNIVQFKHYEKDDDYG